jgi:hypothetical protein
VQTSSEAIGAAEESSTTTSRRMILKPFKVAHNWIAAGYRPVPKSACLQHRGEAGGAAGDSCLVSSSAKPPLGICSAPERTFRRYAAQASRQRRGASGIRVRWYWGFNSALSSGREAPTEPLR